MYGKINVLKCISIQPHNLTVYIYPFIDTFTHTKQLLYADIIGQTQ